MFKKSDYPDNPNDLVIKKGEFSKGIKEIDIWNYYSGIKDKLIPELKGRDLFVVIAPKAGQELFIRHPYDKKSEFIRINNSNDFEQYHSGKTVEYHRTSPSTTDEAVFDFDPGPQADFKDIKNAVNLCLEFIKKQNIFKKDKEIRFTGSRGFHITTYLKSKKKIESIKKDIEDLLKEYFKDNKDVVIATNKPPGKKVNIDLSQMKVNGGHISPYSLRIKTGLVCMPIKNIDSFNKEDATLKKIYKKLTGNKFIWDNIKKESSLNFSKISEKIIKEICDY